MTKEEKDKRLLIAGKHLGGAYLLITNAIDHIESAEIELEKMGLNHTSIKYYGKMLYNAFDRFFNNFKKYIGPGDGAVVLRDFEQMKPEIDKILDLNL